MYMIEQTSEQFDTEDALNERVAKLLEHYTWIDILIWEEHPWCAGNWAWEPYYREHAEELL